MISHFRLIGRGLPVQPLLDQIDAAPHLWGSRGTRQKGNSPHRDASDIWLRYMAPELLFRHNILTPHESVWYPESEVLSGVHAITVEIMCHLGGLLELGGILLTKIPPGKEVYWHNDRGAWHAEHFDLKTWTILRGNGQCVNHVENESMVWRTGECWHHSNMLEHRVQNQGETERICLIVCTKRIS